MKYKSDKDIENIGHGLIERVLPKSEWTHAAHFAAAAWLLTHPDYDAFLDMPDIIRKYNEATGVPNTETDGYHETITIASLRATKFFLKDQYDHPLWNSVNALLASEFGHSDWILNYWSKEVLFSPIARQNWVDPDIKKLPF